MRHLVESIQLNEGFVLDSGLRALKQCKTLAEMTMVVTYTRYDKGVSTTNNNNWYNIEQEMCQKYGFRASAYFDNFLMSMEEMIWDWTDRNKIKILRFMRNNPLFKEICEKCAEEAISQGSNFDGLDKKYVGPDANTEWYDTAFFGQWKNVKI